MVIDARLQALEYARGWTLCTRGVPDEEAPVVGASMGRGVVCPKVILIAAWSRPNKADDLRCCLRGDVESKPLVLSPGGLE